MRLRRTVPLAVVVIWGGGVCSANAEILELPPKEGPAAVGGMNAAFPLDDVNNNINNDVADPVINAADELAADQHDLMMAIEQIKREEYLNQIANAMPRLQEEKNQMFPEEDDAKIMDVAAVNQPVVQVELPQQHNVHLAGPPVLQLIESVGGSLPPPVVTSPSVAMIGGGGAPTINSDEADLPILEEEIRNKLLNDKYRHTAREEVLIAYDGNTRDSPFHHDLMEDKIDEEMPAAPAVALDAAEELPPVDDAPPPLSPGGNSPVVDPTRNNHVLAYCSAGGMSVCFAGILFHRWQNRHSRRGYNLSNAASILQEESPSDTTNILSGTDDIESQRHTVQEYKFDRDDWKQKGA